MLPDNSVCERFLEFVEVKDKTGVGLSNTIKQVLAPLNVKEKLVAQTYDGAAVMSGNVRYWRRPKHAICALWRTPAESNTSATLRRESGVLKVCFCRPILLIHLFHGPKRFSALAESTKQTRFPGHWVHDGTSKAEPSLLCGRTMRHWPSVWRTSAHSLDGMRSPSARLMTCPWNSRVPHFCNCSSSFPLSCQR